MKPWIRFRRWLWLRRMMRKHGGEVRIYRASGPIKVGRLVAMMPDGTIREAGKES